ncbi:hypothetical protein [Parasulfitobacter algicola]|uniref:Tripartite tricarboxylate transporter TctB family protein n=1 Tax=Parasulfitobacter algicola TaxID=2614809 RepID=A0ABX2ITP1_9RHOB|nr:hypothetical protein [Sulfitobacter algicola]NSX53646.1 hypothetical protein [Sulfitobacter algicola]
METNDDIATLRTRDFWSALIIMALSVFFLWKTFAIPLFGGDRAGVSGAEWYNSAAIVPLGIFGGLLILSVILLITAIRQGGATAALTATGIGWNRAEAIRFTTIGLILFFYLTGLVPRVDFIIASGLLITALTYGYHSGQQKRMIITAAAVVVPGAFSLVFYLPQAKWNGHVDDYVTLVFWITLMLWVLWHSRTDKILRLVPIIAITAPILLICVMAFGFRQNIPARGGLIFKQIEYHYYVTLRPIWRG